MKQTEVEEQTLLIYKTLEVHTTMTDWLMKKQQQTRSYRSTQSCRQKGRSDSDLSPRVDWCSTIYNGSLGWHKVFYSYSMAYGEAAGGAAVTAVGEVAEVQLRGSCLSGRSSLVPGPPGSAPQRPDSGLPLPHLGSASVGSGA